jgi:hypothetical protein
MGRPSRKKNSKIEKALHKFGAESIEKLVLIAESEDTPAKLKADIWRWFAEMEFGKPTSKQISEDTSEDEGQIVIEGELELWSR